MFNIFLTLAQFIEHIQPVHDLLHVGSVGQLAVEVQGILFGGLHGLLH